MFCRQTFEVWQPLKQTVTPKVSCLFVFDERVPLKFHFSQPSVTFLAQKQHTCLQKLFLTSKNLARTDFVEQKQIKSTTAAYSKLRTFGAKTCHFCTQLEHVFFLTCTRLDATDSNFDIYLRRRMSDHNKITFAIKLIPSHDTSRVMVSSFTWLFPN